MDGNTFIPLNFGALANRFLIMDEQTFQKIAQKHNLGHIAKKIYEISEDCVRISTDPADDNQLAVGASKIGGKPDVPPNFEWPYWHNSFLSLLIQINLSELQYLQPTDYLPTSGMLSFFFEHNKEAEWFNPAHEGACRVYYFENLNSLVRTNTPEHPDYAYYYPACGLEFKVRRSFPHPFSKALDSIGMTDLELESNYWNLFEQIQLPQPNHQLFGHPYLYQSDSMDVTCQLVSNGIYTGDGFAYSEPDLYELRQGAKEWMFLLQLDSDRNAAMHWGISEGSLYFWTKRKHLTTHHFGGICWVNQFI